ncbi:hypothetical protein DID88_000029 [Monilinia fructigena]|uniref:Uncharacterized protein n=1 Tax=Monilinia fructigena TaxID=38457 RepID=A0A395IPF9_9HELO|nr:hypothetical protein DID88_000029 [Monilinia fructigena]
MHLWATTSHPDPTSTQTLHLHPPHPANGSFTPTSNVTLTNTTSPALFINPSATFLTNVGFSGCGPANGTTKGFVAFGNWAMWRDLGTQKLSSSFYATPVSEGVWQLMWNAQEIDDGKSVSVAVRKVAPSS